MSKIFPVLLTLLLAGFCGYGQSQKAWISAADTAYVQEDYYAAFKYYEIALEYDSSDTRLWFNYSNAARKFNAFPYAQRGYERVLSMRDTGRITAEATYWLAYVHQRQGNYQRAADLYQEFLDQYEQEAPEEAPPAERQLESLRWAMDSIPPSPIDTLRHLGPEINTPYSEFGAAVLHDTFYYSSFRFVYKKDEHDPPRKFIKVLRSTAGTEGELLSEDFNKPGTHVANTAFSDDGSEVFYTICHYIDIGELRCDLYRSRRQSDGSWGPAEKLAINAEGYTTTQPAPAFFPVSGDSLLFFASNRPGGEGGLDLWYSRRNGEGGFETPVNLSALNTSGDEATPFFHQRSNQFFFSSDGHRGLGGLDLFMTERSEDGTFLDPENLGAPVNSSYNDTYYTLNDNGSVAFFSSDRAGSTYIEEDKEACCFDIYRGDIDLEIDLLAKTFNSLDTSILEGATVYLYEITPEGEEILVDSITNPLGNDFRFPLERYKKYRIDAKKPGFEPATATLDLTSREFAKSTTIEQDLFLNPGRVELQALTFDAEDNTPLDGTTVSLMELVDGQPQMVDEQTNPNGNDFLFPLEIGKTYIITAQKPGFNTVTDTIRFTPEDIARLGPRPTVELYLERISFEDFLPLALYFDNDRPNPRTYQPTTDKTYGETYDEYYNRKEEFINRFTEGLTENDSFLLAQNYENFFERDVQGGYLDLMAFSDKLLPFLEEGNTINIRIKGYSSPRAATGYNLTLSRRRINSLVNHFREYKDGALAKYIDNGQLVIEEEAFGESTARGVPDDIRDEKNSIYSLLASVERRVEIIEVTTGEEDESLSSPDK